MVRTAGTAPQVPTIGKPIATPLGGPGQLDEIEVALGESPDASNDYTSVWVIGDPLTWTTLQI